MEKQLTIYVSGLYSGTNPQPGVGIARSLKQGYPDAKLIGVEYSNRCSGIHWLDFDDIWLQRPWTELNLELHRSEIERRLDDGALWISSIDLEIMWLAEVFPNGHPNLLTPTPEALDRVGKPAVPAHEGLPVRVPPFVTTELSDWELHAFCRKHNWNVWLKGPYYEAVRITNWAALQHWIGVLSSAWATDKLFLQAHVTGYEESVMLSAYQGELLDCVHMRKRDLTDLGKTWAGDATTVDREIVYPLRKIIRDLKWTGGAEIEMVRDAEDQLWLLEWNPRFPAWVHGSTITGRNLPAELVEGATGERAADSVADSPEFTRVVIEIPVRREFPLPPLPEPFAGAVGHSMKHPSGLIEFAQRLRDERAASAVTNGSSNGHVKTFKPAAKNIPATYLQDLATIDFTNLSTPSSLFLPVTASEMFRRAAPSASISNGIRRIQAYSIKTNPDERLLRLALDSGFYAEAISPLEVRKALNCGFPAEQIVLNGPAKWWRRHELPDEKLHAVFCDSVEELEAVTAAVKESTLQTDVLGIRIRTPNIVSRFGIPVDSPQLFESLVAAVRELPKSVRFGVHFHMASSNVGVERWNHLLPSVVRWCGSIEALSGRVIECLDIGGGWDPEDVVDDHPGSVLDFVTENLSGVREVISEPGKAIAQPSMAVAMSVLEIRNYKGGSSEAVMDGSIAELPMYSFHPHRILSRDRQSGDWRSLERGDSMLFGRLCMEHDIVASNVALPADAQAGDVFVFCDAGAYDRSMSYVFGCG
ncbi:MAG TPA: ATP-grasp domain-containing protein [Pyrinomonadaceae bacterium]|nr:ATP-grasp domain-containing protein [Pyrinomonadaceae bacterium]